MDLAEFRFSNGSLECNKEKFKNGINYYRENHEYKNHWIEIEGYLKKLDSPSF